MLDEIHALVPTKRGSHLALSLERLEALCGRKLQRIGLSATQRPLDEVARFLGGAVSGAFGEEGARRRRRRRRFSRSSNRRRGAALSRGHDRGCERAEAARSADRSADRRHDASWTRSVALPSGPASQAPVRPSIWSAIHPKLLELVRAHTSTIDFRQQPPAGGADFRRGQRTGGRDAGARASRQRGGGPAQGDRRPPQDGHAARAGGDLVAGTGHRHGRDRPGGADRSAALGGERDAARRARQPSAWAA